MKLTNDSWIFLAEAVSRQAKSIEAKADRHGFNVETCAKNGATETILGMILELESSLRVMKQRLIATLSVEDQSKYPIT